MGALIIILEIILLLSGFGFSDSVGKFAASSLLSSK